MPVKSKKQYNFMQMIAHGGTPKKDGPSKSIAKEFIDKTPKSLREKYAKKK